MPVSIITVDVDDARFKEFQALFSKHKTEVEKMPQVWHQIDKAVETQQTRLEEGLEALLASNVALQNAVTAQGKLGQQSEKTGSVFHGLEKSSHNIAANIAGATKSLVKWASLTTLATGLLGAGGIWGMDRLAQTASSQRRDARGLGTTPAQQQAFGLEFSQYGDANGMLQRVVDAQHDASKRGAFAPLGLSGFAQNSDPVELAMEVARRSRALFKGSDQSEQFANSHGLTAFADMNTLRRYAADTDEEFERTLQAARSLTKKLAMPDDVRTAWKDFDIQLNTASTQIGNAFIRGLQPLLPGLTHLSAAFSDTVDSFLRNKSLGGLLDTVSHGLDGFAKWLETRDLQADFTTIIEDVEAFGRAIGSAATWIEGHFPHPGQALANVREGIFGPLGGGAVGGPGGYHADPAAVRDRLAADLGLTQQQAAGIVGNLYQENKLSGGAQSNGDIGWASYTQSSGRKDEFLAFAKEHGLDPEGSEASYEKLVFDLKGKYHGVLDALKGAGDAAQAAHAFGPYEGAGVPMWMNREMYARQAAGMPSIDAVGIAQQAEGRTGAEVNDFLHANGEKIDAARTAWCAAFVNSSLQAVGVKGDGSDVATSFLNWGQHVDPFDLKRGDILVQARGHGAGETGGHVGFATGRRRADGTIEMISGNEGGKVATTWEASTGLQVRRAVKEAAAQGVQAGMDGSGTPAPGGGYGGLVSGFLARKGASVNVGVTVSNQTGGSPIASAAQLPQ